MDQKGRTVIYIDPTGVTHEALVFSFNVLNAGLLDLVYVDTKRPDNDNIVKVFSIEHVDAKKETNPDLPAYPLNAWKEYYEEHQVIPPDHPNFDHPFKKPDLGLNGQPIPAVRPITDAVTKAHQEQLSQEDADELKALSGSGGLAAGIGPQRNDVIIPEGAKVAMADGSFKSHDELKVGDMILGADGKVLTVAGEPEKVKQKEFRVEIPPVTTTDGLQDAIEGIAGASGEQSVVSDPSAPQQDGGDPPNCQPGQLC